MSHGCYNWVPGLVWLHVMSDSSIFLAYITIQFTPINFARRRKDLPFNRMSLCFGVFIVADGLTQAMEAWNLWHGRTGWREGKGSNGGGVHWNSNNSGKARATRPQDSERQYAA
jgi:hypothetical protein